jgi:dCMP deaminase
LRITKEEYYLNIARSVSLRSTCLRRRYGSIIVNQDEIVGTGYNGSARGEANCCEKNSCIRKAQNIPHGERYEKCVAVHAEMNAIISAGRKLCISSDLYLYGEDIDTGEAIEETVPCGICINIIKNAGIKRIITKYKTFEVSERSK